MFNIHKDILNFHFFVVLRDVEKFPESHNGIAELACESFKKQNNGVKFMSTPNYDQNKLASIKTYMLIAFIFGLIATILFVIAGIAYIALYASALASLSYYASIFGANSYTYLSIAAGVTPLIVSAIAFLVIGGIGLYIFFFRIRKMYSASKTNDVATLKRLNSMLWAILCLIFTGVLPGIMLLIAYGPINDLGQAQAPPPPPPS